MANGVIMVAIAELSYASWPDYLTLSLCTGSPLSWLLRARFVAFLLGPPLTLGGTRT